MHLYFKIGLYLSLLGILFHPVQAETSPLLDHLYTLQCAKSQTAAQEALNTLRNNANKVLDLPTESFNAKDKSLQFQQTIYAASIDIGLNILVKTAKKYPALRLLVEQTLLQWNYCQLFENGKFYDLNINQARRVANYKSPLNWLGFKNLGFLGDSKRFVPQLLSQSPLGKRAFEAFFHRIYRKQCFPHPVTSKMFHTQYRMDIKPIIHNKTPQNSHYPYQWNSACAVKIVQKPNPIKKTIKTTKTVKPPSTQHKVTLAPTKLVSTKKVTTARDAISKVVDTHPVIIKVEPNTTPIKPIAKPKPPTVKKVVNKVPKVIPSIKTVLPQPSKPIRIPDKKHPIIQTAIIPTTGNNSPIPQVISENPSTTHGITGNFYIKQSLSNTRPSIGATAVWKPIIDSYWFARISVDYNYQVNDRFSYSWGIGYNDWHEDTWSVQLNNWGPIQAKDGLALKKSILNIGYKFKSDTLAYYNIHLNSSVDIPIQGEAALNLGMQWNPKENWYIRANINQNIRTSKSTWSYGFGYSNWRVGKVNIEYANYGANELFEPNFKENGVLSMSYNWEF